MYRVTESLPASERYGLSSQARRAAVSIGANLAEGAGRASSRDFRRFVGIALASSSELEHLLMLASDLEMIDDASSVLARVREVRRMLVGLRRSLAVD